MSSSPRFSRWSSKKDKRPNRSNGDQYYYITDFNQVSDKDCINFDKANDKIYMDNLKLFNDINKKLRNSIIKVTEKPKPPSRPNNYERLFIWRQRNIKLSVEDQTIAILYLLSKNINIKLPNSFNENGIEPWEAIYKAEEISKQLQENKNTIAISYLNLINDYFNNENKILSDGIIVSETNNLGTQTNQTPDNQNSIETNNNTINNQPDSTTPENNSDNYFGHRLSRTYPSLNDREVPMNMNFNLKVDNGFTPDRRNTMYFPDTENHSSARFNIPSAPSAPPPSGNITSPPGYKM